MSELELGERFIRWAEQQRSVVGLVQIGSRVRSSDEIDGPTSTSDWDFQLIVSTPEIFNNSHFLKTSEIGVPFAFVSRAGRLGSARKVTSVFHDGELDLVIIPETQLRGIRSILTGNNYRDDSSSMMQPVLDQALVLAGGYRILKGNSEIHDIYRIISRSVQLPRLSDRGVREIAEGFVCDYISTIRKIDRGELVAAQRWLHHYLIEANLRLLHELQLRRSRLSFPDARRIEAVLESVELEAISISAVLTNSSLREATDKAAATLQMLMRALGDSDFHWPLTPAR